MDILDKEVANSVRKLIRHEVKEYLTSNDFQEHLEYTVKVAEYMLQRNILERNELEKLERKLNDYNE